MIYDYLLTAFKVIIGLITTERLIYGALLAIAFYLLWIGVALLFSFQRRFNRNCVKLYNFINKNKLNAKDVNSIDYKASKISSGFLHSWKRFKSSAYGKPSDFITRRESLDVEVTGGVLNQGKSFMKAFIDISSFGLFLLNLAYLGNNQNITCYLIAESLLLPTIYFVICKILYFLYTSIKQQLYKSDIECLYELIDLLDVVFAKSAQMLNVDAAMQSNQFVQGDDEVATDAGEELEISEQIAEPVEDVIEEQTQEEEEDKQENVVDKYDIFKRKNIDVDKLLNEVPNKSSSLPYINVDSDYVIKDDQSEVVSKTITNLENGSELLGGMMQDMSSIRNAQKSSESDNDDQNSSEEKSDETKETETNKFNESSEKSKADDLIGSLDAFEVENNAESSESNEFESLENAKISEEDSQEIVDLVIPDVEPINLETVEQPEVETETNAVDDISDEKRENIAAIVGGFKAKSKLASGGVVIERNEPISRRDRNASYEQQVDEDDFDEPETFERNSMYQPSYAQKRGVTQLSADNNADNVLNTFRNSTGGYEGYQGYNSGVQGGMYGQGYVAPQYNQTYSGFGQTYNQPIAPNYGVQGYQGVQQAPTQNYNNYQQQNYESYDEDDYEDDFEEDVEETPEKPKKVKRSKDDEPRPRNLKKRDSKKVMEEVTPEKKRGRPKKQVFDESVSIKNDKEFDVVLARAEKLMRKSEQGLSASQSKRIEKELKMLMDAMNKYKDGV